MRSLGTVPAMIRNTKPMTAKSEMVQSQPWASSLPEARPNLSTNGSVRPCTTNWAMVLATKRMLVMEVRS